MISNLYAILRRRGTLNKININKDPDKESFCDILRSMLRWGGGAGNDAKVALQS